MKYDFAPVKFNSKVSFCKKLESANKAFIKSLDLTLSCANVELDDKVYQSIKDVLSDEANKITTLYTAMMNKIDSILGAHIK